MELFPTYEELTFTNDFVFCQVLVNNKDLCKRIAELATGRKIERIVSIQKQKTIKESPDGKGFRFDVVFEDDKESVYDIEMQLSNEYNLPKRSRYYQSMIDMETLKKGKQYTKLKDGYIIFICKFDPFGKGFAVYNAETRVIEAPDIEYYDGMKKIFLNSEFGDLAIDIDEELRDFLRYVHDGTISSTLTGEIDTATKAVLDDDERRAEYVSLQEYCETYEKKGIQKGMQKGISVGKEQVKCLMNFLFEAGRFKDAKRAAKDDAFCEKLLSELADQLKTK